MFLPRKWILHSKLQTLQQKKFDFSLRFFAIYFELCIETIGSYDIVCVIKYQRRNIVLYTINNAK